MNRRVLGRTGIEVSELSFGGVEIGIPYGIGVTTQAQMPGEAEAIKLLHEALDNGINYFDTARLYGRSEEIMGKAFKGRRDDAIICTKCVPFRGHNEQLPPFPEMRKIADNSLSESLSALDSDYIDVYMIHDAHLDILGNHQIAALFSEYRTKGLVRAIGVSTYKPEETRKAIESGTWDVIQLPFNLMNQGQAQFLPLARQREIAMVVRSVLLKGILTDRGRNLYEKLGFCHPKLKVVEEHREKYDQLLSEAVPRLSDLAIKFVLSHSDVSSVLIGTGRIGHLREALSAADGNYLDEKALARARELAYPEPDFLDLGMWLRMGWLRSTRHG